MANLLYRASAGSGKTYTLVRQFLLLALQGSADAPFRPSYFSGILAVTFTKKASAEMKARIIEQLWENIKKPNNAMAISLAKEIGIDETELAKRSKETLTAILSTYGKFSISTIDSFFQQILRSFLLELGLAANLEIEMDMNLIVESVSKNFLAKIGTEASANETKNLLSIYKNSLEEGNKLNIHGVLQKQTYQLLNEKFQPFREAVQEISKNPEVVEYYRVRLKKVIEDWKKNIDTLAIKISSSCQSKGISSDDFTQKSNGYLAGIEKLISNKNLNPSKYSFGKCILGTINKEKRYAFKKEQSHIEDFFDKDLKQYNDALVSLMTEGKANAISAELMLKNWSNTSLIQSLNAELIKFREDEKILPISDTGNVLSGLMTGGDIPFIYEKIGTKYNHIFIDEFQDTSIQQWENLLPLLNNNGASNKDNLLVGDAKQSIYRFRGGDVGLILNKAEADLGSYSIDDRSATMDTNFRSHKEIVAFNNAIYHTESLPRILVNEYLNPLNKTKSVNFGESIQLAYAINQQKCKKADAAGLVEVSIHGYKELGKNDKEQGKASESNEDEEETEITNWTEKQLYEKMTYLATKGFSPRDICILTYSNDQCTKVVKWLNGWRKVLTTSGKENLLPYTEVVNEGNLLVADSITVKLIVAALGWLADPENKVKKLETKWLYAICKNSKPLNEITNRATFNLKEVEIEGLLYSIKQKARSLGFYEVIEEILRAWDLPSVAAHFSETKHLNAFTDAITSFSNTESGTVTEFLEWWEIKASKLSVAASDEQDAIRLMTIHKSKGLQFPAVIMPFGNWLLGWSPQFSPAEWVLSKPNQPLVSTDDELDILINGLPFYLELNKASTESSFSEIYYNEVELTALDALNKLYVGTTRPEQALFLFAEYKLIQDPKKEKINSTGKLLLSALNGLPSEEVVKVTEVNDDDLMHHENAVFVWGNMESFTKLNKHSENLSASFPFNDPIATNDWRGQGKLHIKPQAQSFFTDGAYLAYGYGEKNVKNTGKNAVGHYLHLALAAVNNTGELIQWIKEKYLAGEINSEMVQDLLARAEQIVLDHNLNTLLLQGERTFVEREIVSKEAQIFRPDRVQVSEKEVICIDFKTGKKHAQHKEQLTNYLSLLSEIYPEKEISGRLVYVQALTLEIENVALAFE